MSGEPARTAAAKDAPEESAPALHEPFLREMTLEDVPAVVELENRLFPHDAWPEHFFTEELAQTEAAVGAQRSTRRYWVAVQQEESGESVIGYAGMMCVLPLADVQTIAVAPEAQGQGLGAQLLAEIETEARRRGAESLLLEVRADNPGAQRLYLRTGFEEIRRRPGYYPDGEDALIMLKQLHSPRQPGATAFGQEIR